MSDYDDPDPSVEPEAEALLEYLSSPWAPPLLHLEQLCDSIGFFRGQLTTKDDAEHLALHGYLLHDRPDETWLGRLLGRLYPAGPEPTYTLVPKPRPVLAAPDEPDDDWGPPTPGERRSSQPDVEYEKRWNPMEPFPFLSADVAETLVGARPDRLERRRNMLDVIAAGLRHAQARRPGKVSLLRDSLQALCGKCDFNQIRLLLQADAAYLNIDDRFVTPRDPTIGPWFGGLSFDIVVAVHFHAEAQTQFYQQMAAALDVHVDARSFPRSDPTLGRYLDTGRKRSFSGAAVLFQDLAAGAIAQWETALAEVAELAANATGCARPHTASKLLDLRVVKHLAAMVQPTFQITPGVGLARPVEQGTPDGFATSSVRKGASTGRQRPPVAAASARRHQCGAGAEKPTPGYVFKHDGLAWTIKAAGRTVIPQHVALKRGDTTRAQTRPLKGLHLLRCLLRHRGHALSPLDLEARAGNLATSGKATAARSRVGGAIATAKGALAHDTETARALAVVREQGSAWCYPTKYPDGTDTPSWDA